MRHNKIFLYLMMIGFFAVFPTVIFASNFGLAVDKTAVVFDADIGETQKFIVGVKNISEEKQKIVIDVMNYDLSENNEIVLNKDTNDESGIKTWIDVQDKNIILMPGDSEKVIFDVNVSEEAIIGSHRGAVIFKIVPNSNDTVQVQGQVGVHVLINIKGDTQASGRINSFDIPFLASGLIEYQTEFENVGNIHYVPYGDIVVTNIFTKKEEHYKYDKRFAFPNKKIRFSLTKEIPSLFGFYKAKVTFVDGEGATRNKTDYTMGYFFPLIFIGILVSLICILWFIIKYKKRNKNTQKTIKQYAKKDSKTQKEDVENNNVDENKNTLKDKDDTSTEGKKNTNDKSINEEKKHEDDDKKTESNSSKISVNIK